MNKLRLSSRSKTAISLALVLGGLLGVYLASPMLKPASALNFPVTRFDDPPPGDCSPDNCSLREAVMAANATPGADNITLAPGTYTLSILGAGENSAATGDLDITDDLIISGSEVVPTIIDGGGHDRVFHLFGADNVEISSLTIQNGDAGSQGGGGILVTDMFLTLNQVTVRDNMTDEAGGGIFSNSELMIMSSALIHNTAGSGGGLLASNGGATLINSTISGNTAFNAGGGILTLGAVTRLVNVTVSHNNAPTGGGLYSDGPGMVSYSNTIVADQGDSDDCFGTRIFSAGYNLDSDGSCFGTPLSSDLPGANALLGPLQNHGGPTLTHALLPGSAAVDAAHDPTCSAPIIGSLDQRA